MLYFLTVLSKGWGQGDSISLNTMNNLFALRQARFVSLVVLGLMAAAVSQAELLVYEGFHYAASGPTLLSAANGGLGMTGTWSATSTGTVGQTIYNQGVSSGVHLNTGADNPFQGLVSNVVTTGGYLGPVASLPGGTSATTDHMYGSRALNPSVTATFVAGTTTWLSFVSTAAFNLNAASPKLVLGASDFTTPAGGTATTNRGLTAGGQAIGLGGGLGSNSGSNTAKVFGQFWAQATPGAGAFQDYDPTGLQTVNSASTKPVQVTDPSPQGFTWTTASSTYGIPNINIGKIIWSDVGPDVISFARFFETDGALTEANFNAVALSSANWSIQPNLAQSQFDTISFTGGRFFLDELRVATDFENVVSGTMLVLVPEPSTLGLLVLGGLGLIRRRRLGLSTCFLSLFKDVRSR